MKDFLGPLLFIILFVFFISGIFVIASNTIHIMGSENLCEKWSNYGYISKRGDS